MESTVKLADTNNVNGEKNAVCTALTLTAALTSQGNKTQPSGFSSHRRVGPSVVGLYVVYTGCSFPTNWVLFLPAPQPAPAFIAREHHV